MNNAFFVPIGELSDVEVNTHIGNNGTSESACWSLAFSPDKAYLAWSMGYGKVKLLPWQDRNVLNRCSADHLAKGGMLIDCKAVVKSMCFGIPPNLCRIPSNNYSEDVNSVVFEPNSGSGDHSSAALSSATPMQTNGIDHYPDVLNGSPPQSSCGLARTENGVYRRSQRKLSRNRTTNSLYKLHLCIEYILAIGLETNRIKLWRIPSCKYICELASHSDIVNDLRFAPDQSLMLASASSDSTLKVWDLIDDGNMSHTLKNAHGQLDEITCCQFSPDCTILASGSSGKSIVFWNTATWQSTCKLSRHRNAVTALAFSPDGLLLCSASYDTTVIIWSVLKGLAVYRTKLLHIEPYPSLIFASGMNDHFIRSVSFFPDGQHVITLCDDKLVRVWNINEADQPVAQLPNCEYATTLAVIPQTNCFMLGFRSGCAKMYVAPLQIPRLQHICRVTLCTLFDLDVLLQLNLPPSLIGYLQYDNLQQV